MIRPEISAKMIGALVGQLQRPGDAEFLLLGGRHRGEMRVVADDPARVGDPEYRGESEREALNVAFERRGAGSQHQRERDIGGDERADAAELRVAFRGRPERLAEIAPHRRRDHPADQVDMNERGEAEDENEKPEDDGEPILVEQSGRTRLSSARGSR